MRSSIAGRIAEVVLPQPVCPVIIACVKLIGMLRAFEVATWATPFVLLISEKTDILFSFIG